ncbi:hypothetical protein BG000_006096, partial [Podila horticola]
MCFDDRMCPPGMFCDQNERECLPRLRASSARCFDDRMCPPGMFCDQNEMECVPHLRGPRRMGHNNNNFCSGQWECSPGQFCDGYECRD